MEKPLPDNTQHSQETDMHGPGGIRTHNPSERAAVDPRLRPRGHWDRVIYMPKHNAKVPYHLYISIFQKTKDTLV